MNLFDYIKYKSIDLDCEAELRQIPVELLLDYYNTLALSICHWVTPINVLTPLNIYNVANFGSKWDVDKHSEKRVAFMSALNQYYKANQDELV